MADTDKPSSESPSEVNAKAVNRAFNVLLLIGLLSIVTLASPDYTLLAADASLKLPYLGLEVSVASFLIFGPIAVLLVSSYLHLAYGRLLAQPPDPGSQIKDFYIFAIDGPVARLITTFLFYYSPPLILSAYTWKALPRPEGSALLLLTGLSFIAFTSLHIWRQIGRRQGVLTSAIAAACGLTLVILAVFFPALITTKLLHLRKLDLVRAALEGKDLKDVNLSGSDLEGAKLKSANLQHARLGGAILRTADMTGANLRGANLAKATATGADFTDTWIGQFGSSQRVDLNNLKAPYATFKRAQLYSVDLSDADLTGAILPGALLQGANLEDAILTGSLLEDANLSNASLVSADLSRSTLTKAKLIEADLNEANLTGATLQKVDFKGVKNLKSAKLDGADFTEAFFWELDLREVKLISPDIKLSGAVFQKSILSGMDFSKKVLTRANFEGADLRKTRLAQAELQETDFSGADLDGASFEEAVLRSATFKRAKNLAKADFTQADLTLANFTQVDLAEGGTPGQPPVPFDALAKAESLTGAKFVGAKLHGLRLSNKDLRFTNFSGAELHHCDLSNSDFGKAVQQDNGQSGELTSRDRNKFDGMDVTDGADGTKKGKSDPEKTTSVSSPMSSGTTRRIAKSDFVGAKMTKCKLVGAHLVNANMRKATLIEVDFSGADLTGAQLEGADVGKAIFSEKTRVECSQLTKAQNWQASIRRGPTASCREQKK